MSENSNMTHTVVVKSTKSVGVSIILTVLFGSLGLFYSSILGGIIMTVLSIIGGFLTGGLSFIILWPICIIWGALAAAGHNRRIMTTVVQKS